MFGDTSGDATLPGVKDETRQPPFDLRRLAYVAQGALMSRSRASLALVLRVTFILLFATYPPDILTYTDLKNLFTRYAKYMAPSS